MSAKSDKAVEIFQTWNCAQSVFGACGPDAGLDEKQCLMASVAFGGGIAHQGQTCGAVTGALMTISVREWNKGAEDAAVLKARVNQMGAAFMDEFARRHGSVICRELTGCDLRTQEGVQQFRDRNVKTDVCTKLIAGAVDILEAN